MIDDDEQTPAGEYFDEDFEVALWTSGREALAGFSNLGLPVDLEGFGWGVTGAPAGWRSLRRSDGAAR